MVLYGQQFDSWLRKRLEALQTLVTDDCNVKLLYSTAL